MTSTPTLTQAPHRQVRRHRLRRAIGGSVLALALAAGGGAYWGLNRYVIDHVQISNVDAYETSLGVPATSASTGGTVRGTTYDSDTANITIKTVTTGSGWSQVTYYVADVELTDATALRSAFADNKFGTNIVENPSEIAADNDAVFAINGDYYGFRSTGIVIRNGIIYRDSPAREGIAFYKDGTARVYDETATTAEQLVADGVWNTLSFGPALLIDGVMQTDLTDVSIDRNFGNRDINDANPRTAVGVIDANHFVFVVVDGRSPGYSAGVTLPGLAELMRSLGAETAYNLDGGKSSTMVFDGRLVNRPEGGTSERGTSDILYIEA